MSRIFLLSPAHCSGVRARMILQKEAQFEVAKKIKGPGIGLGELFTFLSGLYFRGKMAYASFFADPPASCPGTLIITSCRGLLPPETRIRAADLKRFAATDIAEDVPAYMRPFSRDVRRLAGSIGSNTEVILLGSIATAKYLGVLQQWFGPKLMFPRDFIGRGDMSRGGLLLRRAQEGRELEYISAEGATCHGKRPPKLVPRRNSG